MHLPKIISYGTSLENLESTIKVDFPHLQLQSENEIKLQWNYIKKLEQGIKTITIKYKKNTIRYPKAIMPVYFNSLDQAYNGKKAGTIEIPRFTVKSFSDFDDNDAIADGLSSKDELLKMLTNFYGEIQQDEYLSVYHLKNFQKSNGI